jgi:hypothetical protein
MYASPITFGVSLIPFLVLWIMYTNKIKDACIAVKIKEASLAVEQAK